MNYKYYTHHIISIIIYCILNITIDLILDNFFIFYYKYIYIYIIYLINSAIIMCYLKYMMDKLYYHYTELLLIWGIVGLIIKVLIFSGRIIYEYVNDIEGIVNGMKTYFEETNIFTIIFLQFAYFLIDGGLYYLLTLLELYYLRPNHMLISDEINVYQKILVFFFEDAFRLSAQRASPLKSAAQKKHCLAIENRNESCADVMRFVRWRRFAPTV